MSTPTARGNAARCSALEASMGTLLSKMDRVTEAVDVIKSGLEEVRDQGRARQHNEQEVNLVERLSTRPVSKEVAAETRWVQLRKEAIHQCSKQTAQDSLSRDFWRVCGVAHREFDTHPCAPNVTGHVSEEIVFETAMLLGLALGTQRVTAFMEALIPATTQDPWDLRRARRVPPPNGDTPPQRAQSCRIWRRTLPEFLQPRRHRFQSWTWTWGSISPVDMFRLHLEKITRALRLTLSRPLVKVLRNLKIPKTLKHSSHLWP